MSCLHALFQSSFGRPPFRSGWDSIVDLLVSFGFCSSGLTEKDSSLRVQLGREIGKRETFLPSLARLPETVVRFELALQLFGRL